jgi:hypothetical protein
MEYEDLHTSDSSGGQPRPRPILTEGLARSRPGGIASREMAVLSDTPKDLKGRTCWQRPTKNSVTESMREFNGATDDVSTQGRVLGPTR